jgi:peptidoglycan/xylan/chitin deacetylase (PgdA/CDA1 family)
MSAARRLQRAAGDLLRETRLAGAARSARDAAEGVVAHAAERFLRHRRTGAAVLMYHGVTPELVDPLVEGMHLSARLFRQQIRYLKRRYRIVSLGELVDRLARGEAVPDDWAVLTFDDGYRNNLTCAWEILRAEGKLPMSVFVTTDFIGADVTWWSSRVLMAALHARASALQVPDAAGRFRLRSARSRRERANLYFDVLPGLKALEAELRSAVLEEFFAQFPPGELDEIRARFPSYDFLSWDEVRELHRDGVDVGSHSRSHAYLRAELGRPRLEDEIHGSRARIERELGASPPHFAYPNGTRADFCELSGQLVREAGYRCALTTVGGTVDRGDDLFELRRLTGCIDTMPRFRLANATGAAPSA